MSLIFSSGNSYLRVKKGAYIKCQLFICFLIIPLSKGTNKEMTFRINGQYQFFGILDLMQKTVKNKSFIQIPKSWYCPGRVNIASLSAQGS